MKKLLILPFIIFLLTSCSLKDKLLSTVGIKQEPIIKEISLGKYETPNGTQFELYQFGTGYYLKNQSGSLVISGTTSGSGFESGSGGLNKKFKKLEELKLLLDSLNPLVVDEHKTPDGKVFKITQYKGLFGIIYPDGTKGKGTFETKEGLIKFLDENNSVCHITKEKILNSFNINGNDGKPAPGNLRIVTFDIKRHCEGGSIVLKNKDEIVGKSGLKYDIMDMYGDVFGMGGEFNDFKDIKNEKYLGNDGSNNSITWMESSKKEHYISTYINNTWIRFVGNIDNKSKAEEVYNEILDISKTLKVSYKKVFDWENVSSVKVGDKKGKSLIFKDKNGLYKTVYPKNWDINPVYANDILIESYNSETKTIIVTPLIALHFNDSYTLNVETGVIKNNNYSNGEIDKTNNDGGPSDFSNL